MRSVIAEVFDVDRTFGNGSELAEDERVLELAVEKELTVCGPDIQSSLTGAHKSPRELSLIEAREKRLVEAIIRGDAVEPLVAALKFEEEQRR